MVSMRLLWIREITNDLRIDNSWKSCGQGCHALQYSCSHAVNRHFPNQGTGAPLLELALGQTIFNLFPVWQSLPMLYLFLTESLFPKPFWGCLHVHLVYNIPPDHPMEICYRFGKPGLRNSAICLLYRYRAQNSRTGKNQWSRVYFHRFLRCSGWMRSFCAVCNIDIDPYSSGW